MKLEVCLVVSTNNSKPIVAMKQFTKDIHKDAQMKNKNSLESRESIFIFTTISIFHSNFHQRSSSPPVYWHRFIYIYIKKKTLMWITWGSFRQPTSQTQEPWAQKGTLKPNVKLEIIALDYKCFAKMIDCWKHVSEHK